MILLALLLAAAPPTHAPLPEGTVLLGLSTVEGTRTEVVALTPGNERELFAELEHAKGRLPRGLLTGHRLLLVSAVDDGARAVVEELDLDDGRRRVLSGRALAGVPPTLDAAGRALFVRSPRPERFEVVRAVDGAVLAALDAAWLMPARGRPGAFLVVEGRGGARLAELGSGGLVTLEELGRSPARSPAFAGARALVELRLDAEHARVVDAHEGVTVQVGLAGMDPLPLDGRTLAYGAGTKAAELVVDEGRARRTLTAPRSGVAHPLAGAMVQGAPVVVAWLDRGASLPGELWLFTDGDARRLLEPAVGVAVEVYGVVAP